MTLVIKKPTSGKLVMAKGQPFAVDPLFGDVVLLLHGNGTNGSTSIVDSSRTPKTVTSFGNAQISTSQSKFDGASIALDGNGDYIVTSSSTDFNFGSSNFTLELWLYLPSLPSSFRRVMALGTTAATTAASQGYVLEIDNQNRMTFAVVSGTNESTAYSSYFVANSTITAATWTHFAACRNGSTLNMYANGISVGTSSVGSLSHNYDSSMSIILGRWGNNTTRDLNGYIDDVRISKGARYTSNFTPPTSPFPDF